MIGETIAYKKYRPAGTDADGYKVAAGFEKPVNVDHVGVDMGATYEPRTGTVQRTTADLTLFLPPGFVCDSKDRFVVRGLEYQVEGAVSKLNSMFTGTAFKTEITVRRSS